MHYVEIKILAAIPDHDRHIGHAAVYKSEEPVKAVVAVLAELGLTDVTVTRDIVKRTGPRVGGSTVPRAMPDSE